MKKNLKKIIAMITVSVMILSLAACSKSEGNESTTPAATTPTEEVKQGTKPDETEKVTDAPKEDEPEEDENLDDDVSEENGEETGEDEESQKAVSGFKMSVNNSDGKMNITRLRKNESMGEEDTWTIFVYLCGTDLESGDASGAASSDVEQMRNATGSDNVKFVFQTGGTSEWVNENFSSEEAQRFVVQNNELTLVDSLELGNMGDPNTLSDFLTWGIENYPAEKMGLVFWNHGGGSITGACFDELNESDSLSLQEINTALAKVYENMTDQFEFIGFDCCLMGTAETANIMASYARYFYGSQECEPGSGWDYETYGSFIAENPSASGAELGKVITDSFYEECAKADQEQCSTLTVIDLVKFDDFVVEFNNYAKSLFEAADKNLPGIVRGITNAENFGGNNKAEGYTNMVDIGSIISNCSSYADGSDALTAMNNCIVYNKNGSDHSGASGLSIYYPLQVGGSNELKIFSGICISPYYLSLADRVAKGYTEGGYTNAIFFTEEGNWENNGCELENIEENYFEGEEGEESGNNESTLITFESEPAFDPENGFGFTLDENGYEYTANVSATIYLTAEEDSHIAIGETAEINADWETGSFYDSFDGYWLALPDGQILSTYIVGVDEDSVVYTSPALVNGNRTNIRIRRDENGFSIEGVWDGIGENGIASRDMHDINHGDVIIPLYYFAENEEIMNGSEYTSSEGDELSYSSLPAGEYFYCFDITDVYGDILSTDFAMFTVDEEGNILFGDGSEGEEESEEEYEEE